ncbi:MAG: hypothetical protein GY801_44355 [bacterium]|nr:hypothetical protein [bacterium]
MTENGFSYTYDRNGNMLTKSGNGGEAHGRVSLQYNALNQVTRANISRPQGTSVIDYAYDHDGIRIGKTVNGTDVINFNLWNAGEYSGDFCSIGFGVRSLFANPKLVFRGPWGVGHDIQSSGRALPVAATSTNYELVVPPKYLSELAVAMALVPLSTIPESNFPVPITFFVKSTMWIQTAIAKFYWNEREEHSSEYRHLTEDRPPDFQSGPNGAAWYQGLYYYFN